LAQSTAVEAPTSNLTKPILNTYATFEHPNKNPVDDNKHNPQNKLPV